jgi:hypothetical protein
MQLTELVDTAKVRKNEDIQLTYNVDGFNQLMNSTGA